ncbi:DUF4166 domain-containing protein [Microbacterium arborescens]|uniref:DUF4166 domain-containing protein n=1 Tax=Microbacterium arborescens TaxID=33883 RepID=UPI003C7261AA
MSPLDPFDGRSVYERALGAAFARLDPALQTYFGPIPRGSEGVGAGVYDDAGYRGPRWLRPAMTFLAWRGIMFPDRAVGVPFRITNSPEPNGALVGQRDFDFPRGRRRMVDAMTPGRRGEIVDRLGRRGELEVRLRPAVDGRGGMRLRSVGIALRVGRMRLPLPPVASVEVRERVDPGNPRRQRVEVSVRTRLLGEVFRYRGSFSYRIQPAVRKPADRVAPPA